MWRSEKHVIELAHIKYRSAPNKLNNDTNSSKLLLYTITYDRPKRLQYFQRMINIFRQIPNMTWIVCEDSDHKDDSLAQLVKDSGIDCVHLHHGPTRDKGNEQRNEILKYIRDHNLDGIVYSCDDDNNWRPELFEELRKTKKISTIPIGNLGRGIEQPISVDGKIVDWDAGWKSRKYPLDMGGFAFHSSLIREKFAAGDIWKHKGFAGETQFIEQLINDRIA